MASVLITLACVGATIVAEVAFAAQWIIRELRWLHDVLTPWMDTIHKEISAKPPAQ